MTKLFRKKESNETTTALSVDCLVMHIYTKIENKEDLKRTAWVTSISYRLMQ